MDRYLVFIGNLQNQIIQRQIRFGSHACRDPILQTAQLAMTTTIALGARLQPARLALQNHHVVDELYRNPELRCGNPVRMSLLHKRNNALTKCRRMWLAHLNPPYPPCRQGITDQDAWESESE